MIFLGALFGYHELSSKIITDRDSRYGADISCSFSSHWLKFKAAKMDASGCETWNSSSGDIVLLVGHIENFSYLRKMSSMNDQTSQYEILLGLFKKFGQKISKYLKGDFQLFIWCNNKSRGILIQSPLTTRTLHYGEKNGALYFSSFLPWLKEYFSNLSFNKIKIARFLQFDFSDEHSSFYSEIRVLPNGYQINMGDEGYDVQFYWSPTSLRFLYNILPNKYLYKKFQAIFSSALKNRDLSSCVCEISGGLDSSSVVGVCASLSGNKHLSCYSAFLEVPGYFPAQKNCSINDQHLIRDLVGKYTNISYQNLPKVNDRFALEKIASFFYQFSGAPCLNPVNMTWANTLYYQAASKRKRLILTAVAGNMTISWRGNKNIVSRLLARFKNLFSKEDVERQSDLDELLIMPEYRKVMVKVGLRERFIRCKHAHVLNEYRARRSTLNGSYQALRYVHNVESYDPSASQLVAEFCLKLPNRCFAHSGLGRQLVRQGLNSVLPSSITSNTSKGIQGADWFFQLREALPHFKRLITKFRESDCIAEIINLDKLEDMLQAFESLDVKSSSFVELNFKYRQKMLRYLHVAEWMYLHHATELVHPKP